MKQGLAFQARPTSEKVILTKNDCRKEQVNVLHLSIHRKKGMKLLFTEENDVLLLLFRC